MKIILPWPDKGLSPNARLHWAPAAKLKATARFEAKALTQSAMVKQKIPKRSFEGNWKIPYRVEFYPPDNRRRDDDNMIGSFKAARDGIAEAMGIDDRRFKAHYYFEDPVKPGRVEVHIGEQVPQTSGG